jgi:protein SCO1/2
MKRALVLVVLGLLTACDRMRGSTSNRGSRGGLAIDVSASQPDIDLPLPSFSLVDQRGAAFESESMRGHVTVVDFVFTECPAVCPSLTQKMAALVDRTDQDASISFLSISVDPENDTPAKMTSFLAKYGKDSPRWSFVTGDPDVVQKTVIGGFKIRMDRDRAGTLAHGEHFVVVDKVLRIRGYFDATPEGLDALVVRARALAGS